MRYIAPAANARRHRPAQEIRKDIVRMRQDSAWIRANDPERCNRVNPAPSGAGSSSTAREDKMADTAFVVLFLAGFGLCMLILRALHSGGEQR